MHEINRPANPNFVLPPTDCDEFAQFLPTATIQEILLPIVPKTAMDYFETKSRNLRSLEQYILSDFDRAWLINHQCGDRTYAVHQIRTYNQGDTESLVYMVDIRGKKKKIGHGELRFSLTNSSLYFRDKPFVGFTSTKDNLRRQGLGTRRLMLMNAFAQMLYHHPLHSDTTITINAKRVWEKLERQGMAIRYYESPFDRFVMIISPE